ncbi:hypothetical protein JAAARDRAFT_151133 [Jaapia argillacea MUCL 33604]|uniref:Calcineurin-like phosphoesterase domain-containing protein n=1 Tax=Jaapia argillacea MUCL 33604 TaxID=933084 RepID=A0A067Q0J9_9AGAM|nr:hypothetical protein JAAARDRAFT_151133 [Jaapia argillacea MUCL 33604]
MMQLLTEHLSSRRTARHTLNTADIPSKLTASRATVYLQYDEVPPHPGDCWTRFVCISDTHSHKYVVPPGDVLLHSGDLCSYGALDTLTPTMEWLMTLSHPMKIIIAGNHDLCLDEKFRKGGGYDSSFDTLPAEDIDSARALVRSEAVRAAGIHYLEHESFQFTTQSGRRWKVFGSPSAPRYAIGSFQYDRRAQAEEIYNQIPADTEILLTHTPPYMVLDRTKRGKHAGCEYLEDRLAQLSSCRLHVFGHIHEAYGAAISEEPAEKGEVDIQRVSVNAALAWGGQPVIVDIMN